MTCRLRPGGRAPTTQGVPREPLYGPAAGAATGLDIARPPHFWGQHHGPLCEGLGVDSIKGALDRESNHLWTPPVDPGSAAGLIRAEPSLKLLLFYEHFSPPQQFD